MTVSIPTPCGQNWNTFEPTKHGGFCSSCNKEVIDFTTWKPEDIKAYLSRRNDAVCGRFRASQLGHYPSSKKLNVASTMKWLAPSVVSASLTLAPAESKAQRAENSISYHIVNDVTEQIESERGNTLDVPTMIKGKVLDNYQMAMPGTNVRLKGTNNVTVTNVHGEFSMIISHPSARDTLVFSFIGYLDERVSIYGKEHIDVIMKEDEVALSEEIIVGGVCSYRWYSPRRMWYRIKGLFSRKH